MNKFPIQVMSCSIHVPNCSCQKVDDCECLVFVVKTANLGGSIEFDSMMGFEMSQFWINWLQESP